MMYRTLLLGVVALALAAVPARAQSVTNPKDVKVRPWVTGIQSMSGITFLPGSTDAFVSQRESGKIFLIRNRAYTKTVLDLPVARGGDRGLLDVELDPNFATNGFVYVSYTGAAKDGAKVQGTMIDRFKWNGSMLVNKTRLKTLPASPSSFNLGGRLDFGADGKLYAVLGDMQRAEKTQNNGKSSALTGTSVILRMNADGSTPTDNPFYSKTTNSLLRSVYAYGIRDSRGLAVDPLSGRVWSSENGAGAYDEINQMRPGTNSGWKSITGPLSRNGYEVNGLVKLASNAKYIDPRFSWQTPIDPVDMAFMPTDGLGKAFMNDLFVASGHGTIYHFDLTSARDDLVLTGGLRDRVADNQSDLLSEQQGSIIFGWNFGEITDIEPGPDGLYVISKDKKTIYEITGGLGGKVPEPAGLLSIGALAMLLMRRRARG